MTDSPPNFDHDGLPVTNDGKMLDCRSLARRLRDSFKRNPDAHFSKADKSTVEAKFFDVERAALNTASSPLRRELKGRHLQMIAIGGAIGTGLFVGSGKSLATGGPASVLIAFSIIGIMLYNTVHALGEMAVAFPIAGSFSSYSTRFLDPAWGFAMGWNYALQWFAVLPLEIVSAALLVEYWHSGISSAIWVTIFYILIVIINFFGVRGYGEAEYFFSIIKVIAIIGFIILGVVLNVGGGPGGTYIGNRYWKDPGAFHNGFRAVCSVFVNAAFAFGGVELAGLASAETANPRKTLPSATKQVFWRITLFYVVSLAIVGLLVPYNDPRLLIARSHSANAKASPFVIAIKDSGIKILDSVMNVVIIISVLSVGNSSIYAASRTLAALAEQHQAPQFLAYVDRRGRPLWAIIISSAFGFFGYFSVSDKRSDAFTWMMAISGLSSIFTWGSICLAHIRFRRGWKYQGHHLNQLAWRSQPGIIGSWIGFLLNCLVLIAQFWTGFAPVGYTHMTARELTQNWFSVYLAGPIVIACYIFYKIRYRTRVVRAKDMDLDTGRRDINAAQLLAEERAERAEWPLLKKIYRFFW